MDQFRMTHDYDGELVVFLIGMKITKWWRPDLWGPTFTAMPRMLAELERDPDSGLLGYRMVFDPRGPWLVQYWSSLSKLYAYATDPGAEHRPAWTAFNRRARQHPNSVGIWHETFVVDRAETIYSGMRSDGLAKFVGAQPLTGATDRARQRVAASALRRAS